MDKNALGNPCEKHSPFPKFVGECRRAKLNEICSKGKSSLRQKDVTNDGPYSVYGASGAVGTTSDYQNEIPYVAVIKDGAGVGRASACEPMTSVLGTMQALIPNPNVERDYLLYIVRSLRLDEGFSGSTIPHIYFKDYGKIEVPLPSLEAQKRIVSQLGLIEAQIEQAEAQITQLDQLVKSRFVEMFGDLLKNSKGQTLDDISELITVGIANAATHAYADKGTIMLRNLNIRENRLDDTDLISIRPEFAAKYKKKALKSGDILVTRTGYPGVACIVPEKYAGCQTFTTLIVRLDASSGASATFVSQYINSPLGKEYVNKMKAGSSQQNFGATSLKSMPIVVPPLALQQEFADFVTQVDKLRFATQRQIEKLETLKKSLMQEYFG